MRPFDTADYEAFGGAEAHDQNTPPHAGATKNYQLVADKTGLSARSVHNGAEWHLPTNFHVARHLAEGLPHELTSNHLTKMGFTQISAPQA